MPRPPIVVILGHIDHGKSQMLETIRKVKMLAKESGGITQHVGAYEVLHNDRRITFLDTPGHEAFGAIRSRGAAVADIGILVVAADESVKPQTKEAIAVLTRQNLPFIVAINKIDRPEANAERVRQDLATDGVMVEQYGGKVPAVEISALTGKNLDELLDTILLMADVENFTMRPDAPAEGVVIETHRSPQRGNTATLLIRDGSLQKGMVAAIGRSPENIRILEDFLGNPVQTLAASAPAIVAGLAALPAVGELFRAFLNKDEAEAYIAGLPKDTPRDRFTTDTKSGTPDTVRAFRVILKADAAGSLEALEGLIAGIPSDAASITVLDRGVGMITEADVKTAIAGRADLIAGFRVRPDAGAGEILKRSNTLIVTGDIIYNVIEKIKTELSALLPPEIRKNPFGIGKILKVFKTNEKTNQIVGGRVEDGKIRSDALVEIKRNKDIVGHGRILQLQQGKEKVPEIVKGLEFGILLSADVFIQEGDVIEIYQEEKIERTL